MADSLAFFFSLLLIFTLSITSEAAPSIGINYGRVANDLPPPSKVVQLLKSQGITRVKLYDTDATVLSALSNTGIKVVVAMPNELLSSAAGDQSFADNWVKANISAYHPATQIEAIAVGNEVFVDPNNTTNYLVPAMNNVYNSLKKLNLHNDIKISSPIALSALSSSYPTSSGSFKSDLVEPVIKPLLEFLRKTGSYLMVNAYPFFAYAANSDKINLSYALFENNPGVVDSGNGFKYNSLFDAQVDAVNAATSALQYGDVKIVVSETGWPSKGDSNEIGASEANAASYNGNLVKRVLNGSGTPLRPNDPLNVFLFALFNENQKPGPTSERNYGLFYPTEQKVYDIPLPVAEVEAAPSNMGNWCVANGGAAAEKCHVALARAILAVLLMLLRNLLDLGSVNSPLDTEDEEWSWIISGYIDTMADSLAFFFSLLLIFTLSITSEAAPSIGINYGRVANDLPPPSKVVQLLKSQGITRVKLYDTDATVLSALSNTGIKVVVAMPNELLSSAAGDQFFADNWVEANISAYYPATQIEAIAVGNEVFVDPNNTTNYLVPAMNNVYNSLKKLNLHNDIKVSSPIAFSALSASYPTSSGSFKPDLVEPVIKPMLEFLRKTGSYLMVNVYPFFAYAANSDKINLSYALFENNPGVVDSGNGFKYNSLFDAQVDAVNAATSALQYGDVKIVVSETGWPSKGDSNEIGASEANAASYNGNLVKRVLNGSGTPLRPNDPLNVFLFALFNENQKPGPTSERNYGLFYPTEQKVYDIPLPVAEVEAAPSNMGNWCVANGGAAAEKCHVALARAILAVLLMLLRNLLDLGSVNSPTGY
ncbi:hypothetical protein HN51_023735 [Arachis hypogaea]